MSKDRRRSPIVAVMGHVDHGKTSILDYIRKSAVQKSEHGGITQSIGAYQVVHKEQPITFIDTPGHAAFSKMRARGSKVADIVMLVVAADGGVQPQTVEALSHARAAGGIIVIVINKIDLETANPNKVKAALADLGLDLEEYGGTTKVFETSAITGKGIDALLDGVVDLSHGLDLSVDLDVPCNGLIIESQLDPKKGPVATAIVLDGVLQNRDCIVAGETYARIKLMSDWRGEKVQLAEPGIPVEILGFADVPEIGVMFNCVKDVKTAQAMSSGNKSQREGNTLSMADRVKQAFFKQQIKEIPVIVKADTQGGLEAVIESIVSLSTDEVVFRVLHSGIGEVNENDVFLAVPVRAVILAFNVDISQGAKPIARREKVLYRSYTVIYHLIEELQDVVSGEIDKLTKQILGKAKVKKLFELSDGTVVAGCEVVDGEIVKGKPAEIVRGDNIIAEVRISSLRQGKDDVGRSDEGDECGIMFDKVVEVMVGDLIQVIE